jgi:threonine synthase
LPPPAAHDPHTATGIHVTDTLPASDVPMVVLATAHPAKFPAAVKQACGVDPKLPDWLGDLMARKERFTVLPSAIKMVEDYLGRHSRAVR